MITNTERKTVDMEARDINFILSAYIRQYLFMSKNEDPDRIVFPMFPSVPHPTKPGVQVPIEWVPMTDPIVAEIIEDGKDVAEVTPAQEAALDEKDKQNEELKAQAAKLGVVTEDTKPTVKEATKPSERVPKQPPGGDLGTGHPDGLGSRNIRADSQIARDLAPEKEVEEEKEIPAEIEKPKE
jgi:hypothetical protein